MEPPGYAAVVLAGGAARRLGGISKPALPVAGRRMLDRVLAAVADAVVRVVVGPAELPVPAGVVRTQEHPAGGGPVAGLAAGLALVPGEVPLVAVLAADLPLLDVVAVRTLRAGVAGPADVAVFVDRDGRRQGLCGVWRVGPLRAALDRLAPTAGVAVRRLLAEVRVAEVSWPGSGPPPWFDCDTDADLKRVREWVR